MLLSSFWYQKHEHANVNTKTNIFLIEERNRRDSFYRCLSLIAAQRLQCLAGQVEEYEMNANAVYLWYKIFVLILFGHPHPVLIEMGPRMRVGYDELND